MKPEMNLMVNSMDKSVLQCALLRVGVRATTVGNSVYAVECHVHIFGCIKL